MDLSLSTMPAISFFMRFFNNYLTFVLILFVVLLHVLGRVGEGMIAKVSYNWISSFVMPLFTFISGYFTRPACKDGKYLRSTMNLLSIFILFDALLWIVFPKSLNIVSLLTPQFALWYLLSLFYWRILSIFIRPEWLNLRNILLVYIFSLFVGFVPKIGEVLSFNRTCVFLCFFVSGMASRNINAFRKIKSLPIWAALFFLVLTYLLVFFIFDSSVPYAYVGSYNGDIHRLVHRGIFMLSGIMTGIGFIRISQIQVFDKIADLGSKTMFYYIYHTFFIAFIYIVVRAFNLSGNLFMCAVYTMVILLCLYLLSRLRFLNKILEYNLFSAVYDRFSKIIERK